MTLPIEDKQLISEMLSRAAYAYDESDLALLERCFAPEAAFTMRIAQGDLVGPFVGREAIMGLFRDSMAEQVDVRRHVISNLFFETDDAGQPLAISNLSLLATEDGAIQLLSAGIYRDTLVQSGGDWQILQRHIDLDKPY